MKQSTLNFAAAKRTASNSYTQVGKPKFSSSTTVPKPKTTQLVTKATFNKRESNEDHIDDYDDVVIKESSGEEIEEVASDALKEEAISSCEDSVSLTRRTRSQTKPGKEKASNLETTSQPFKTLNLKPEDLQKKVDANELPELDPLNKRWNKLHNIAKVKLGGVAVHGKDDNKVKQILRVFDNSYEYGPCVGMSRLERWERAESLGLNPPKEIYEILMTKQGQKLTEYKQSVFHGEV